MRVQTQRMPQPSLRVEPARAQVYRANKQRSQLRVALAILLVALVAVLVRDREFWFGPDQASESATANPAAVPAATRQPRAMADLDAKQDLTAKSAPEAVVAEPANAIAAAPASPRAASKRAALPPLQVNVVGIDTHHTIHLNSDIRPDLYSYSNSNAGNGMAKVQTPSGSRRASTLSATAATLPTNAAQRESLASASLASASFPELRQAIGTTYPVLGPRMNVQGSVVLQAIIGADGAVESLHVVSGPAILTAAAQQAVRQWHFKPYLENGQPVETKATITVNFSIKVGDNPEKAS